VVKGPQPQLKGEGSASGTELHTRMGWDRGAFSMEHRLKTMIFKNLQDDFTGWKPGKVRGKGQGGKGVGLTICKETMTQRVSKK